MNLINGNYLNKEICAFSDDWLIVFDGKWNYMLFNTASNEVLRAYKRKNMPSNNVNRGTKDIEYYSSFDNALKGLRRVLRNDGF